MYCRAAIKFEHSARSLLYPLVLSQFASCVFYLYFLFFLFWKIKPPHVIQRESHIKPPDTDKLIWNSHDKQTVLENISETHTDWMTRIRINCYLFSWLCFAIQNTQHIADVPSHRDVFASFQTMHFFPIS